MELKDMVLSTLQELDNGGLKNKLTSCENDENIKNEPKQESFESKNDDVSSEEIFLKNTKERLLVLFDGLQSENCDNLDTKLDITLNFLEYLLANIEKRLDTIK